MRRLTAWLWIVLGGATAVYGLLGVLEYGFRFSGRWSIGQTAGGLAPLFLLIGVLAVCYGVFELCVIAPRQELGAGSDLAEPD